MEAIRLTAIYETRRLYPKLYGYLNEEESSEEVLSQMKWRMTKELEAVLKDIEMLTGLKRIRISREFEESRFSYWDEKQEIRRVVFLALDLMLEGRNPMIKRIESVFFGEIEWMGGRNVSWSMNERMLELMIMAGLDYGNERPVHETRLEVVKEYSERKRRILEANIVHIMFRLFDIVIKVVNGVEVGRTQLEEDWSEERKQELKCNINWLVVDEERMRSIWLVEYWVFMNEFTEEHLSELDTESCTMEN